MKLSSFLTVLLLAPLCASAGDKITVTVANELDVERPAETIVVPWSEISSRWSDALLDHIAVEETKTHRIIPAQVTNFEPENKKGHADELIFQHDFTAGEHTATFIIQKSDLPMPPIPTKTFARYVPDRLDDFAWENDRIGHRIYGPAIELESAGKERLTSSGLDVWCKRVRYPIVDRWYLKGHDNYHKDTGEGLDMYEVGKSRGCGGTGIWDGNLHVSHNWKTWRVLANGPVRTIFELAYEPWDGGGVMVAETKRFTVDAGHNLDQMDSTFEFENAKGGEISVAIGIAKHKKGIETAEPVQNEKEGWFSLWEKYTNDGQLGTGVVLPAGALAGFAEDAANYLVLTKVKSGQPLRYYVGAGWDRSGDFPDRASWEKYLSDFATRLKSPLKVSVGDAK